MKVIRATTLGTIGLATVILCFAARQGWSRASTLVDGKTIGDWIQLATEGDSRATNVLNRLGSEYGPELCRRAEGRTPLFERLLQAKAGRLPAAIQRWIPDGRCRENHSQVAFRALRVNPNLTGQEAGMIPAIARHRGPHEESIYLARDHSRKLRGNVANYSTPEIIGALTEAVGHPSPWIQYESIYTLGRIGPPASNALPAIQARFEASGRTVAQHAAFAVWQISGERTDPLRILLVSLTSSNDDVLQWVGRYLPKIVPAASNAMPRRDSLLAENQRRPAGQPPKGMPGTCGLAGPLTLAFVEILSRDPDPDLAHAA